MDPTMKLLVGLLIAGLVIQQSSGMYNDNNRNLRDRDSLTNRQRAQMRNYQHIYDPYPFDFRGFYWLRPPPVFRVADEKKKRGEAGNPLAVAGDNTT